MSITYYEVYDYAPYLNDRSNVCFNSELLGRYRKFSDALVLAEDYINSLGIQAETYTPKEKIDKDATIECVIGIFYDVTDKQVGYMDDWDYGRFVSIIKKEIEVDIDLRKDKK
jgi:hypothetical protein